MTVIKHSNQRVGVFIDVQNLYHSARNLHNNSRVNFEKLLKQVVSDRTLVRAIGYVIETEAGDEAVFHEALINMGIETRSKPLQTFQNNAKKADWDVGIAVDMIRLAPKLDVIVLVSGDGDFEFALEYVKKFGCQVEIAALEKHVHKNLSMLLKTLLI